MSFILIKDPLFIPSNSKHISFISLLHLPAITLL